MSEAKEVLEQAYETFLKGIADPAFKVSEERGGSQQTSENFKKVWDAHYRLMQEHAAAGMMPNEVIGAPALMLSFFMKAAM